MTCVFEVASFDSLKKALGDSSRNRLRCFDVSENFIIAGSSSGDVFLFERSSQRALWRTDAACAKLDRVAFNPTEDRFFATATNRGEVSFFERTANQAEKLGSVQAHCNRRVEQLVWSASGAELIAGDHLGRVSVTGFAAGSTSVIELGNRVVQVDTKDSKMIVSTLSATYLCELYGRRFTKVGRRPRNGAYGACFLREGFPLGSHDRPDALCARPGGRLWSVNGFGEVECTLMLKHEGSTPLDHASLCLDGSWKREGRQFTDEVRLGKLLCLDEWLVSYTDSAVFVLDIDPCRVPRIVWQSSELKNELSAAFVFDDSLFLSLKEGSLLQWRVSLRSQAKIFYMLSTAAQRLAVICQGWTVKHLLCLDLIRRRESLGREVAVRSTEWQLLKSPPARPTSLTMRLVLRLLRYFEGFLYSSDVSRFLPSALRLNLRQWESACGSQNSGGGTSRQNFSRKEGVVAASAVLGEPRTPSDAKDELRRAHREFLCKMVDGCERELADSMLVELNASFWLPRLLQDDHYVDSPLAGWGTRTDLRGCCDSCGERLVIHGIEEDLRFHYCGHQFHVTCNPCDRLCCICMQRGLC